MVKKTETRDYKNFDYLDATVKKNRLEQLTAHYAALGWACAESRDDKIYFDIKHLVMRRPHHVAHKDELQLLQIYLEAAWNKIGKAEANPCPKTLAAGLFFGIFALAATVFGLLCGIRVLTFIPFVWGYVLCGAGAAVAVINVAVCVAAYKRERSRTMREAAEAGRVIERVCREAAALTDAACAEAARAEDGI